jgi:hypothetical protein
VPVAFGEGFKLVCANELQDDGSSFLAARPRHYLGSCRLSERFASRMSNRQVVYATSNDTRQETVWFFEAGSQTNTTNATKYLQVGSPVPEGAAVMITHRGTARPLLAEAPSRNFAGESTDFGAEAEVVCHFQSSSASVASLTREMMGKAVGETCGRAEQPINHWAVIMGPMTHDDLASAYLAEAGETAINNSPPRQRPPGGQSEEDRPYNW